MKTATEKELNQDNTVSPTPNSQAAPEDTMVNSTEGHRDVK